MVQWYENRKNVLELAKFMVESEQIVSAKELLDYFSHPERWTEVWELYQEQILGIPKPESCKPRRVPNIVALVQPSAQCTQ